MRAARRRCRAPRSAVVLRDRAGQLDGARRERCSRAGSAAPAGAVRTSRAAASAASAGAKRAELPPPPPPPTAQRRARPRARPTPRRGRRTRAPAAPRRPRADRRRDSSRPTSFSRFRSPAGTWSWRPCPCSASISTVHEPMPGIARSRRQPCSWRSADRSTRPRATSRAARTSVSARQPARSKDCSSAGEVPARRSAAGRSRERAVPAVPADPAAAQRGDDPPLDRGRSLVLDQLLADRQHERLEGLRAPSRPAATAARRTERPISGSRAKRRRNGRWSSSRPSAKRIRAMPWRAASREGARAPSSTRSAPGCGDAHEHGLLAVVEQALEHAAAAAQHPVHAVAARQPERAGRSRPPRAPRPGRSRPRPQRSAPGPPSRCTSTSSERLPTICSSSPAPALREPARRRPSQPSPGAASAPASPRVAAVDETDDRRAGDEAAGGGGGGLDGGKRAGGVPARARALAGAASTSSPSSTGTGRVPAVGLRAHPRECRGRLRSLAGRRLGR